MPSLDDRPPVDAILQKVLEAVPFQLTADGGIGEARRRFRDLPRRPVHPDLRVENHDIDGPAGPIPVRVYWPENVSHPPVTMYFHGGGFAVGDLDTHDGTAREHAVAAQTLVVSVDYRLAPEHPYPAAVDDAWAATRWAADNADRFGADDLSGLPPAYIAVAGHDPLRDDGARYAELLAEAGVTVELHNAETLVHGYLGYTGVVPAATEATQRGLAALRAALHG